MKMAFLLAVLCVLSLASNANDNRGSVSGTITSSDGSPAELVTVRIKENNRNAVTNDEGTFSITNLAAGNYTLEISLTGYETVIKSISVANAEVKVAIQLTLSKKELEEVIIHSNVNRFTRSGSNYVARMPLKNLENPQAYSIITKELISEQIITDFSNVLKNSAGVYKIQGVRNINTDGGSYYAIRGFRTEASMADGVPSQNNAELDPANVEKVEVLKGPSGTLYGSAFTSFGGMINLVTKKPQEKAGGTINYTGGSFDLNRLHADVYGPLNEKKNLLFRLNAAYQSQGSWQDAGMRKTFFLAPSLLYRVNDRLDLSINASFFQSQSTSPSVIFLNRTRSFMAKAPSETGFDWKRSYTSNDLLINNPVFNVRAQLNYKLSSSWTATTSFSSNNRGANGYYQYEFIRGAIADTSFERTIALLNTTNTARNLQQFFTGDFHIGALRNRVLIGLDYLYQSVYNNISPYIVFDVLSGISVDSKTVAISRQAVDAKLAASTAAPSKNTASSSVYSMYVSDVLNITEKLMAMLSLRLDRFENNGQFNQATQSLVANTQFGQTTVSPKLGLVYQLVQDRVALFANYSNGFANVPPVTQPLSDISGSFKPQHANQVEAGVKLNLADNRLSLTASYYNIEVDNMTRPETINRGGVNYNITVQNGTQLSRGVEVELAANPFAGLHLVAGYGYNHSIMTKSTAALEGRRPPAAGPSTLFNTWISYTTPKGKLKGLGVGFGGNSISEHLTANSSVTGVFTLPAYTLVNASVFYDEPNWRIGVKGDNLGDALYFTGQGVLSPQAPRNYAVQFTVKF